MTKAAGAGAPPKQAAAGFTPQAAPQAANAAPRFALKSNPAEDALASGYKAAPTPKAKPGLAGLRANAAIDQDKLKAALNGIHRAQQPNNQASMAQSLLDDNDLADYQDDIPEDPDEVIKPVGRYPTGGEAL